MNKKLITLVTSRLQSKRPDLLLLKDFEQYCSANSNWQTVQGPWLFSPIKLSCRLYTALHTILHPFLKKYKKKSAVLSLGLPHQIYIYSITFPYFTISSDLRVLWTYDVWEPIYKEFEITIRKSKINLLLLSSSQATQHFQRLNIPGCQVHWVPESINPADYKFKPWNERQINILSFGRAFSRYHDKIVKESALHNINYHFENRKDNKDVAVHGVKPSSLQFPKWQDFINALADAQICICFPKVMTHPEHAGNVSTLTLRYLQAMASKCLIIGAAPLDAKQLFNYNPVIEVDWNDPFAQIQDILKNFSSYQELIERNYQMVCTHFHHKNAISKIDSLIRQSVV